jgi:DNA-binding winged helix-turn-helix (wHTH) protein/tetratricopeptide (TPR) repeat protein
MSERYEFGDCVLDADALELLQNAQRVDVRPRVLALLVHLIRHRDRVVSKEELLEGLWPGHFVAEGSLTQLVYEARRLLGETASGASALHTVRGRGYRFVGPVHVPSPTGRAAAPIFTGRQAEQEQLVEALEAALAGRGQLVMLHGDAGIGKTSLALRLSEVARARGAEVHLARCAEARDVPPFWPWTQILREFLRTRGVQGFREAAGSALPQIARLLPDLGDSGGAPADGEGPRFRLFDGVSLMLSRSARAHPCVILLEDLQWMDAASLELLSFVARGLTEVPLLILATFRDAELTRSHPLTNALLELRRHPSFRSVALRPLGDAEIGDLITQLVGGQPPRAFLERACRLAEGNPFFATELVQHWIDNDVLDRSQEDWTNTGVLAALGLPRSVHDLVKRRIAELSPECVEILEAAAVLGREFDPDLLGPVAAAAQQRIDAALDEAYLAGMLRPVVRGAGRQEFTHGLSREALYWDLPPQQRKTLHRRAGEALEARSGPAGEEHLAALSHHFFQAAGPGELERPIHYGARAASQACRALAFEDAVKQYRRVLDMVDLSRGFDRHLQAQLWIELADALVQLGKLDRARTACRRAAELARDSDAPELLARAALGLGAGRLRLASEPIELRQVDLLEEALASLAPDASVLRARVTAQLAAALATGERAEEALALGEQALALAERSSEPVARAHARYAHLLTRLRPSLGPAPEGVADQIVRAADEAGEAELGIDARLLDARILLECGQLAEVDAAAEDLERRATGLHATRAGRWPGLLRAGTALARGQIERATTCIARVQQAALEEDDEHGALHALLLTAVLQSEHGAPPEREAALRELLARADMLEHGHPLAWSGWLDDTGDPRSALRALNLELVRETDDLWSVARCVALARATVRLRARDAAVVLHERLAAHAGRFAVGGLSFAVVGGVDLTLGQLSSLLGRGERAIEHLDAAIAGARACGLAPFEVRARLAQARVLLEMDADLPKVVELVDEAVSVARSIASRPLESAALGLRGELERSSS